MIILLPVCPRFLWGRSRNRGWREAACRIRRQVEHAYHESELRQYLKVEKEKCQILSKIHNVIRNVARCQFHQRFSRAFFIRTLFQQLFSSYMYVEKRHSYKKFVRKMLMKLTACGKYGHARAYVSHNTWYMCTLIFMHPYFDVWALFFQ